MKYDGMLYGNGLSLNLIKQLELYIEQDKRYLLNINDFLKAFIDNRLSEREENHIFRVFFKLKNIKNRENFEKIRNVFSEYYKLHDANIEYWTGVHLFKDKKSSEELRYISTIFPSIYNIWHEIMIEYIEYKKLNTLIEIFEESIRLNLDKDAYVYTTNFDRLSEGLKPKHLHGFFKKGYKKYEELILASRNEKEYYYKCLWGYNGMGKIAFIQDIIKNISGYEEFFDFNFFFDDNIYIKNLLVYGMGFQKAGYMEAISEKIHIYKKPTIGGIVDEHILLRLNALQLKDKLQNITFGYYSDKDLQHYRDISDRYELKRVNYIKTSSLPFLI